VDSSLLEDGISVRKLVHEDGESLYDPDADGVDAIVARAYGDETLPSVCVGGYGRLVAAISGGTCSTTRWWGTSTALSPRS
jgi:hypothetical protein